MTSPLASIRRGAALFFVVAFALTLHAAPPEQADAPPLTEREKTLAKSEPLALTSADLLAWAESVRAQEDNDVVILLNEARYVFDDAGRMTSRRRIVYTTRTQASADRWAPIEAYWSPWNQERPEMIGRVVSADGVEHRLDPKTIDDAPVADSDETIFSDRRRLRAPLPGVGPGSVVEQLITVRETQPLFDRGVAGTHYVTRRVPVRQDRLEVDAPAGLSLKFLPLQLEVEPVRTTDGARTQVRYEVGPFPGDEMPESGVPSDISQWKRIAFSTGTSWQDIASRYHEIVEEQIAAADLKKIVKEAAGKEKDPARIVEKIVARLHRDVRYTGIEFAEASIVPRKPADTLGRRFGDCKDKAALLVAMLREAGIPASVALLSTGPGDDVEPELPGFGMFDHAIVYVAAPLNRWIDATDEMGNIATLPRASQNRLALIAAPGTTELVRTPGATAADNHIIKSIDVTLSEFGKAKFVETTTYSGAFERIFRHSYDGADKKKTRENLEAYVKERYLSEKLEDLSYTESRDLSKPFALRLQIAESGRGVADLSEAVVGILPSAILDKLPEILTTDPKSQAGQAGAKRKHDFVFDVPVLVEWRYRIVAPPGFRARALPEKEVIPIGTASITKEFRSESDQVILANLTFDTGKTRLTPAEFEAFRDAAVKFQQTEAIILGFDQIGYAHLLNGEVREALAEYRRLGTLHPKEALHHVQTALALLAGGLGEAARKEADAAIASDPRSQIAHQIRGWIYQHDLLGRHLKKGFDLDVAVASYRKAKELEPKDATLRGNIAVLLEHDANGVRYGKQAKLAEAIAEYEAIQADLGAANYLNNLAVAFLRSGDFAKMKKLAEQNTSFDNRRELLLIAEIALAGADAIPRVTAKIVSDPEQRRTSLVSAGETFLQLRRYPEGVACLLEAAKGSKDAADLRARADAFRNVKPAEELAFPENDPTSIVKRMFMALRSAESPEDLAPLLAKDIANELRDPIVKKTVDDILGYIRGAAGTGDAAVALDLSLGTMQIALEGDDQAGYRALIRALGAGEPIEAVYYVVKEDDQYRIAAPPWMLLGHGLQAQKFLAANDLERTRQWLDWAREELADRAGDDPVAGHVFLHFWKKDQKATREELEDAVAVLLNEGSKETVAKSAARFEKASKASTSNEQRLKYDLALAHGYRAVKDGANMEAAAVRIATAYPDSKQAFLLQVGSFALQDKHARIRELASQRLAGNAKDDDATRALAEASGASGDYEDSIRLYRKLIDGGKAIASDYNNIAWFSIWKQPVTQTAVDDAQQAVRLTSSRDDFSLHTLATVYAEQGKTSEAKDAIWQAMDVRGSGEPSPHDYYVLGRIAEEFGILDAAVVAYKKVEKEDGDDVLSTWSLAQKRLNVVAKK